jgi:hypothetical protein
MGRGRNSILKQIFTGSKKTKQHAASRRAAAEAKKEKEVTRAMVSAPAFQQHPRVIEAKANYAAERQKKARLRCRMMWSDKPGAVVSGIDILMANATSRSVCTQGFNDDGKETQMFILGDGGGHAALQLVAVDIRSMYSWISEYANSGLLVRFNDAQTAARDHPIYALPRVISYTDDPGVILQPGWEVTKQVVNYATSFAGPSNEIVEGASALLDTAASQYQMHKHKKPQLPKHIQEAKAEVAQHKDDADFRVEQVKTAPAVEFSFAPGKAGIEIGRGSWYFRQAHASREPFGQVMKKLNEMWHG